jgi:RNA polymerase sigma-70 factor (ECF subfamily)
MDENLVVRAQQGDQQAFEALAIASHPRLHKVALGVLRDSHLAEDATQQALLDIWRHLGGLREPGRFEAWSYRILVRACHAEAKRRPGTAAGSQAEPSDEPRAADAFDAVVTRDQLERGFRHLSVDHRAVIVLRYLLDMTLEQVAETLELPIGTVNSRLSRATDSLRGALEADGRLAPSPRLSPETTR